jgi:uncharacterized protein YbaP (TraB family)
MVKSGFMKKAVLAMFVLILAAAVSVSSLPAGEQSGSRTSLWKCTSGSNTVYLLGSVHFLKKENYPLPAVMEKALADADTVVFEIDMITAGGGNDSQLLLSKGIYPPGRTLSAAVHRNTYELLRKKSGQMGLDIKLLNNFRPWFVTLTLLSLKLKESGFDPDYGIDRYFQAKAAKSGKKITALETMAEQIDIFAGLSDRDQEALILQTLNELDTMDEDLGRLVDAWRNGDGDAMAGMILKSYQDYPVIYNRLIVRRNQKWLGAIERYLRQDRNVLLVVGAGHLVGSEGLIAMLQRRGYVVDQL